MRPADVALRIMPSLHVCCLSQLQVAGGFGMWRRRPSLCWFRERPAPSTRCSSSTWYCKSLCLHSSHWHCLLSIRYNCTTPLMQNVFIWGSFFVQGRMFVWSCNVIANGYSKVMFWRNYYGPHRRVWVFVSACLCSSGWWCCCCLRATLGYELWLWRNSWRHLVLCLSSPYRAGRLLSKPGTKPNVVKSTDWPRLVKIRWNCKHSESVFEQKGRARHN